MGKERKAISSSAIIVFDRDVRMSELNELTKDFNGDIVITGELLVDECPHIKCDLHIMGYVICTPDQSFNVEGDLYCYNEMASYNMCIDGNLYCEGTISSDDIRVEGTLCCKGKIEAYGGKITVMGDFECHGIKANTVEVYGETYMEGPISIRKFMRSGC